jgi:mRNA-degrading endonuclease toxin of MazEF toxin-antitoxin module
MQRGEIWLVNFAPQIGAEIQKHRPALVVAQGLMPLQTRIVVPFRDRKRTTAQKAIMSASCQLRQTVLPKRVRLIAHK